MSVVSGRQFLLHLKDGADYVPLAGLQTRFFQVSAPPLARLDVSASRWRHLQAGGAVQSLRLTGEGLFEDAAAADLLHRIFAAGAHAEARVTLPGLGRFSGPFAVTELAYEGEADDLIAWRLALASAGEVRFEMA